MCRINYQIDNTTEKLLLTTTPTSITTFKITNVESIFSSNFNDFERSKSDVKNAYLYSTESVKRVLSIKEDQIEKSNMYPNENNIILQKKYGKLIIYILVIYLY